MQIRFAFGQHGLDVTLPEGPRYEVIESRSASALPDVAAALNAALDRPIGSKPLSALAAMDRRHKKITQSGILGRAGGCIDRGDTHQERNTARPLRTARLRRRWQRPSASRG